MNILPRLGNPPAAHVLLGGWTLVEGISMVEMPSSGSSLWARTGGRKCCYRLDCLTAMGKTGSQMITGRTAALNC